MPSYPSISRDEFVARLLIDIWTLATGKTLRCDVPPGELTAEELIDFWSDDHLEGTRKTPSSPESSSAA